MDNPTNTPAAFDEPDEDILTETASDEELEAAAEQQGPAPFTVIGCRSYWPGSCPGWIHPRR
jgi:hypothetical protein